MVRASEPGRARADDALILERAMREHRSLITLDEHSGDRVVLPLSKHPGVIRMKAHPPSTENVAKVLLPLLANRRKRIFATDWRLCRRTGFVGSKRQMNDTQLVAVRRCS
jgi:predicted nuclease of predicted toxin-antitoxin system